MVHINLLNYNELLRIYYEKISMESWGSITLPAHSLASHFITGIHCNMTTLTFLSGKVHSTDTVTGINFNNKNK